MPFRLRYHNRCVTTYIDNSRINATDCINYNRKRYMEIYSDSQVYQFYPLITVPQQIKQYTLRPQHRRTCLTVIPIKGIEYNVGMILGMKFCEQHSPTQLFVIELTNTTEKIPQFEFDNNNYLSKSNDNNLNTISAINIKWKHPVTSKLYCLAIQKTNGMNNKLTLKFCHVVSEHHKKVRPFILERTTATRTPYLSGITVGKFPTWSDP